MLGFVGLVLSIIPVVILSKGEQIRKRSPFMREAGMDARNGEDSNVGADNKQQAV